MKVSKTPKIFLLSFFIFLVSGAFNSVSAFNLAMTDFAEPVAAKDYIPGELIVKYKKEKVNLETVTGKSRSSLMAKKQDLQKKEDFEKVNISVLKITDGSTVEEKVEELKKNVDVEYVEPNYRRHASLIDTNDTYKNVLWGLDNTM